MQCIVTVIFYLAMVGPLSVQCQERRNGNFPDLSNRLEDEQNLVAQMQRKTRELLANIDELEQELGRERRSLFKFEKHCAESGSQVEQLVIANEQLTSRLNEAKLNFEQKKRTLQEELRKINSELHSLHEELEEESDSHAVTKRHLLKAVVESQECYKTLEIMSINLAECRKTPQEPGKHENPADHSEPGSNNRPPKKTFRPPGKPEE